MAHTLSLREASPYSSGGFMCNLCWEKGCGPVYHCSDCDFDIHITCAADAKQQTHFSHHQHLLHLCHFTISHKCDGCGEDIRKWAFRCGTCDYDMHSLCVRAPRFILHPTHSHPLALSKASEQRAVCNACDQLTVDLFYQCCKCDYNLHQICARLPSQFTHFWHPQHVLRLQCKPPTGDAEFKCAQCGKSGKTWSFACTSCQYYIHPHCARISHELPRPDLGVPSQEESRRDVSTSSTSSSISMNVKSIPILSSQDLQTAEKVLYFAQEMFKVSASATANDASEGSTSEEQDVCPTCLEGYGPANPKKITSCGHHFHLHCILNWMERCKRCPMCRKNVILRA